MERSRSIKKKLREFDLQKRVKLKHILGQIRDTTLLAIGSSFCHFVWFSMYTGVPTTEKCNLRKPGVATSYPGQFIYF